LMTVSQPIFALSPNLIIPAIIFRKYSTTSLAGQWKWLVFSIQLNNLHVNKPRNPLSQRQFVKREKQ
jgi:hypothetical protein